MLTITGLNAGYGELHILKDVGITVKAKQMVALIGPNGAGKSTVLKSIFNIAKVLGGKIEFNEKDVTGLRTHELLGVGISYVPQGRINFSELTVLENLEIGGDMIKDKAVMREHLEKVFEKLPILREKQDDLAFSLSGGQQQMLALGRALMQNPQLLLLDEPTLGLSPKLQKELFATLRRLRDEEGLAILIVEQNAKKAIEAADRTYLLENGKVALEGGKEIVKNPKIKSIYLGGHY